MNLGSANLRAQKLTWKTMEKQAKEDFKLDDFLRNPMEQQQSFGLEEPQTLS